MILLIVCQALYSAFSMHYVILIFTANLRGRYYYYPHFTDAETEAEVVKPSVLEHWTPGLWP